MRIQTQTRCSILVTAAVVLATTGCGPPEKQLPEKAPRPVSVLSLQKRAPTGEYFVSGAVKSWKTEQIGFEVAGRVEWVLEPGESVEPRIEGPDENEWFSEGTPLAQIDPARYEIALESAYAQLEVAQLNQDSIEIRLTSSLPAEMDSAKADLKLAETEFERVKLLFDQNAASQSEYDQAANRLQIVRARIVSLEASDKQTQGDLKAAEAQVKSARQAVRDAERDLANTTLYASYRGQISDVHVVPGSVVSPGSPVVTLQMMDPIKIEVELSAEKSQEFRRRRQVSVSYKLPLGSTSDGTRTTKEDKAFVYNVATSADPTTRTFSLTLLLINEKFRSPLPEQATGYVPRTEGLWPLYVNRVIGAPDEIRVIEEKSILEDESGLFVLQVQNANYGDEFPELLEVEKRRIQKKRQEFPFLGIWTFCEVAFEDPSEWNPQSLVLGEMDFDGGTAADWSGKLVMVDPGSQWVLRPGDLVDVNLSSSPTEPGYYLPLNAIYEESGITSVFVLDGELARKIEVKAIMPSTLEGDSLVQVQSPELSDQMQVIVGGVHFLTDGDRVNPTVVLTTSTSAE